MGRFPMTEKDQIIALLGDINRHLLGIEDAIETLGTLASTLAVTLFLMYGRREADQESKDRGCE